MKSPCWIARCAAAALALGAPTIVHAIEPCDKNHYILSEPCGVAAIDSAIGSPGAVATDAQGNVYFSSPNLVFKMDAQGFLTRVAGNGTAGFSGDGGPATAALLNFPKSYPELELWPSEFSPLMGPLALDAAGNLYIGDAYNNRVRRVDTNGVITTVVGDGKPALRGSSDPVSLWWPQGVAIDAAGMLFVADATGVLRRFAPEGTETAMTANVCGRHLLPGLCAPQGIAADAWGSVYVADGYCRIRKVSAPGEVVTVAGADTRYDRRANFTFTCGYSGDGGPATAAALEGPYGVAVDSGGTLFIADPYNHCIRKVDGAGIITTVAGACGRWSEESAGWSEEFVSKYGYTGMKGYAGDGGPATAALLAGPSGVAVDAAGNLFIADTMNQRIRKITPDGVIHTVAGNGNALPE